MTASDHHSEYLGRALAGLTPGGRRRLGELLDQLTEAAGADDWLVGFAAERRAEAGLTGGTPGTAHLRPPTRQELDGLTAGFVAIRDQEPLDDVSDWANAVIALLRDETASAR